MVNPYQRAMFTFLSTKVRFVNRSEGKGAMFTFLSTKVRLVRIVVNPG